MGRNQVVWRTIPDAQLFSVQIDDEYFVDIIEFFST
jgi:hypothetical protein